MTVKTPTKFLVYIENKRDQKAIQALNVIREQHLVSAKNAQKDDIISLRSEMLDKNGKVIANSFVCFLESVEEIKTFLTRDIYFKMGVWDFNTLKITEI
ncbi:hypothetical protein AYI69_g407 [Smittium culicis]|uniref:YCII-related domain-containing protein n=1 Tax=Smittium culicis TaxID=133412 RepID=A0A1R1YT59_9FUNG|nr:hypothetical protein AYI69_g407 [Smittium culicis]